MMPGFGRVLFKGSRFVFWVLAPVLVLFAISIILTGDSTNSSTTILILRTALIAAAVLLTIGLYDPVRFNWALRILCLLIFAAFAWFFVMAWFYSRHALFDFNKQKIESLFGLILVG